MVERPGQHAGNDGEQTENHQTGHYQPVARADFSHLTSSLVPPRECE